MNSPLPSGPSTAESQTTALEHAAPVEDRLANARLNPVGYDENWTSPDGDGENFDWRHMLAALRRRKKLIACIFGASLASAVLLTLISPKIYKAQADLLIKESSSNSMNSFANSMPALTDLLQFTKGKSLETDVQILQSAMILDSAKAQLPADLQKSLAKNSTTVIRPVRATEVVNVAVTSPSQRAATAYANAICSVYLAQSQNESSSIYKGSADYVKSQLAEVDKQLNVVRRDLMTFKQRNNIVDLSVEGPDRIAQVSRMKADLRAAEVEKQAGQAQLAQLQSTLRGTPVRENSQTQVVASPVATQLRDQLTQLEVQRLSQLQEFTPTSPEVKETELHISQLRKRLNQEALTVVGSNTSSVNPVRRDLSSSLANVQGQLWANDSRARALRSEISQAEELLKTLPVKEFQLGTLQMRMATLQQTYQTLADKYETLRISQEAPLGNAKVISRADKAVLVSPSWRRNLSMGLFLGAILAVSIGMLVDRLDDKVRSEEDVRDATGLPVLAQVPLMKIGVDGTLIFRENGSALLLESYRMLRTHINYAAVSHAIRTIVVTSTQPHEGKTTAAINLAAALALDGKRVILMDCDLRNPTTHRSMRMSNVRGFTSVLTHECTLEEALQDTEVANLRLLSAGPTPPNPPELLNSVPSRQLLQQLVEMADIVVIDTPPSLIMTDAHIMASMADATIFVSSSNEVGKREVARNAEALRSTGTRLLGVILNKIDLSVDSYYGYYGYQGRYGYKYSAYGLDKEANLKGLEGKKPDPENPEA